MVRATWILAVSVLEFNFIKIIVISINMPFYQRVNSLRAGTYSEFIVGTLYKWKGKKKENEKRGG